MNVSAKSRLHEESWSNSIKYMYGAIARSPLAKAMNYKADENLNSICVIFMPQPEHLSSRRLQDQEDRCLGAHLIRKPQARP